MSDEGLVKAEDEPFQVLVREYELLTARQDQLDARYWSIIGGGLGIATVIAGYVLANTRSIEIGLLAPLFFVVYFSALVFLIYMSFKTMFTLRILSLHINTLLGELILIQLEPGLPEDRLFSFRHGNAKFRLLYFILPGAAVALFLTVLGNGATTIHRENHLYATLAVTAYAVLAVFLVIAVSGAIVDMAKVYRSYLKLMEDFEYRVNKQLPSAEAFRKYFEPRRAIGSAFGWLLPRPVDLVVKLPAFWIGFATALLTVGVSDDQRVRMNFLFYPGTGGWASPDDVPLHAILAMGLVYFLVADVVLQQAKLLWNDVRDKTRDQNEPVFADHYGNRGVQSGGIGRDAGAAYATARWAFALLLGWVLGGWALLMLFLLITLHQIVYELVAKPNAGKGKWKGPIFIIIWLSLTLPLKFLTGALAVVGTDPAVLFKDNTQIYMLLALGFFHSVGQMAIIWRLEAEDHHLKHRQPYDPQTTDTSTRKRYWWDLGWRGEWPYRDQSNDDQPRRQSGYYARWGWLWQNVGVWTAFILGVALFLDHMIDDGGPLQWIGAIAAPVLMLLLLQAGVRLGGRNHLSVHMVRKRLAGLFLVFYLPVFILFPLSVVFTWPGVFFLSLAILNTTWLFLDPDTTHYQYRFMPLFIGVKPVAKAWYAYLFTPENSPGFMATAAFTMQALQADPRANGATLRVKSRPADLYVVCGNGKFLLPGEQVDEELSPLLGVSKFTKVTKDGKDREEVRIVLTMDDESPDATKRPTTFASILTDWPRTGTLIRIKHLDESGEQVGFVVNGAALTVPDPFVLDEMGRSAAEACCLPSEVVGKLLGRMPQDGTLLRERTSTEMHLMDQESPRLVYRYPDPVINDDALHFLDRIPVIKDDVQHFDYRALVVNDINDVGGSDDRDRFPVIVVPDGSLTALLGRGNR